MMMMMITFTHLAARLVTPQRIHGQVWYTIWYTVYGTIWYIDVCRC